MFKKKFIVFFLFVLYFQVNAQTPPIAKDSSNVITKSFTKNIKEKYDGSEFIYNQDDSADINLLQAALRKLFGWIGDIFGIDISFEMYELLEYIVYGIFGVIMVYVIVRFLLNTPLNAVFRKETKKITPIEFEEESIEKVDFEALIKNALENSNYRLATRYLYLKSLQLLANHDIIDWHFDKTNSEYQNEIKNPEIKRFFKKVSYIYDYVWYGEFPINHEEFEKTKISFNQLNSSVKHG